MRKIDFYRQLGNIVNMFLIIITAVCFSSCNKEMPNKLNLDNDYREPTIEETQYKVAYFVVEGGVGSIVAQQATDYGTMPTLAGLLTNGLVSWNGVSAENNDELTSYADLLTGVEYQKHQVSSMSPTNNLIKYPTLFTRLTERTNARKALISSNESLKEVINVSELDSYKLMASDQEVTKEIVEEIKNKDVGFVMGTFQNVAAVGESSGFDSEQYLEALKAFDLQLKEALDALYTRPKYANEKWLIIVTSNKGGDYTLRPELNDGSIFTITERNNFVVAHNNQFAFKLIERLQTVDPAWISSAVKYSGNSGFAALPAAQAGDYNFGKGANAGEYTIQLKLKVHEMNGRNGKGGTPQNGVIFGKMKGAANFPAGWSITYNGGSGWRFVSNAGSGYATDAKPFDLEVWYNLTVKIYKDGEKRRVQLYRDGEPQGGSFEFTDRELSSSDDLQMGFQEGSWGSNGGYVHSIADVRIYKEAISDEIIKAISCSTMPTPASPHFKKLIGYWPANDGDAELQDKSGNKRHFVLQGTYAWNSFSERAANLCPTLPDNPELFVLRSVDVPRMIYNWFNMSGIEGFGLDAQIWNPSFSNN